MKKTFLLVCFLLFGAVIVPGISFAAVEGLPAGMKPLKRNTAVPLTKSECQSLGGVIGDEGVADVCGGKGLCTTTVKGSLYPVCITEMKSGAKIPKATDKTQ
jgi:hypothetical protein